MQPDAIKLDQIRSRGFAVVPGLLTSAQAAEMRSLLQIYVDEDLKKWASRDDYPDRWMVHNLMFRGLPFARLLEHTEMHATSRRCLATPASSTRARRLVFRRGARTCRIGCTSTARG